MRVLRVVVVSIALCIGGVLVPAMPASAATSTVCAAGCDFTTIQAAVTAAAPGDTIDVGAGTYNEFGIVIDKPLTIQGAGEGTTIVDGGGGSVGSVPGIFRILPGVASNGSGVISISDMTLQNPSKNTTASQYFAISIGVKQLTTGISRIDLDQLEIKGPDDPAKPGYGIYADGGLTGGADRVAPEFTLTNSTISGQTRNALGLDAWRGKATVDGNELFEGSSGSSAILVMNEYTPSRMVDPVIVTNNTSQGRLISVRNDVPGNFGGYDDIQITGNQITGLTASDFGIRVGSNTTTGAAAEIAKAVIENNSIRGDGASAGTSGVLILGLVEDAQVNENNIVGVGTGINIVLNQTQSPEVLTAQRNRLFADATGLANATAAAVDATENWWGCQDGPASGSTFCSPVVNTGTGTVDTSTWVVTTASLDDAVVATGGTTGVNGSLGRLNTGAVVALPPFFEGLAAAFSADNGTLDPASSSLNSQFSATSTYTAPGAPTSDTVYVTLDREEFGDTVVTGEPVELALRVVRADDDDDDDGDDDDGGDDDGDGDDDDGGGDSSDKAALPDTGGPVTPMDFVMAFLLIVVGTAMTIATRVRHPVSRHRLG